MHIVYKGDRVMSTLQDLIKKYAAQYKEQVVAWRRHIHSHPELSFEEYDTTKRIKELLVDIGIEVLDVPLKTGLVAIIRGEKNGPTIALRTDIDALPITEKTPLEYKSLHSNVMHPNCRDVMAVRRLRCNLRGKP